MNELETQKKKILMYVIWRYGVESFKEDALQRNMEIDGWDKLSLEQINAMYGEDIDKKIKEIEGTD